MPQLSAPSAVMPSINNQAERLITLGLPAAITDETLRRAAARLATSAPEGSLLVLHERVAPASDLAPLMSLPAPGRAGKAGERRHGFVVTDMTDVDLFGPTPDAELPNADVYVVTGLQRGDDMQNWSPEEAEPTLRNAERTPLTLTEGIHWALQLPGIIEPGACFMTIGSRLVKPNGKYDTRTPALWISGGTGRDGAENKGAPKVGWCWWRNRHTWLGIASAKARVTH
ncbi:DUF5701 family protein [Ancrocorticia populi]|nr:DUF5701 family protein [Ancrocorticia populi]